MILGYPHFRKPSYDVHIFLGTSGVSQQEMYRWGFLIWTNKACGIMWMLQNRWSFAEQKCRHWPTSGGCNLQSWRYAALGVQQWWNMWEVKDSWSWTFIATAQQNMPWLCEKGQHCSNFGWVAACAPRKLVFLNRQTFYARSFLLRQWFFGVCLRENLTGSHYGFSQ